MSMGGVFIQTLQKARDSYLYHSQFSEIELFEKMENSSFSIYWKDQFLLTVGYLEVTHFKK